MAMFEVLCEEATGGATSGTTLHNHVHQLLTYIDDVAPNASDKVALGMALRTELYAMWRHIVDNIATELKVPKMMVESAGVPEFIGIILSDFDTSVTVGAGGSWAGLEASINMAMVAIHGEVKGRIETLIAALSVGEMGMDPSNFDENPLLPWIAVLTHRCGWNELFLRNPLRVPVAAIVEVLPVVWKTICTVWNAFKSIRAMWKARRTKALKADGATATGEAAVDCTSISFANTVVDGTVQRDQILVNWEATVGAAFEKAGMLATKNLF